MRDTRLNLNSERFEQTTGDSLILSGFTEFQGVLRLNDGNQQTGYVLTSDSGGTASWQQAPTTTPSDPDTSVQFNNNGEFSGSTNFTWDNAGRELDIVGSLGISGTTFLSAPNNLSNVAIGNTANIFNNCVGSVAIGNCAESFGGWSVVIGNTAESCNGDNNVVIGRSAEYSGDTIGNSIVIGDCAVGRGNRQIVLGKGALINFNSTAGADSITMGTFANTNVPSIGQTSVAIGCRACSTAINSIGIGNCAVGDGVSSIAIGTNSVSDSTNSIAIGSSTQSIGNDSTIAVGSTVIASGDCSIVMGQGACSFGLNSIAMGQASKAIGANSITIAQLACATAADSMAIGRGAGATTQFTIAVGCGAYADGNAGIAIGRNSNSGGGFSVAVGNEAYATGDNSISIGVSDATDSGAIAIGTNVAATSAIAVGIGCNVSATGGSSVAIGRNTCADVSGVAIGQCVFANNNSFAAGINAYAQANTSVAILGTTCNNGDVAILGVADGTTTVAMGSGACAFGNRSIAIGNSSCTLSAYSVAIGRVSCASGGLSVGTNATGSYGAVSLGRNVNASGNRSIAMGWLTCSTGNCSISIGCGTEANNLNSISIGNRTSNNANYSILMGRSSSNFTFLTNDCADSFNLGWSVTEPTIRFAQNGNSFLDGTNQQLAIGHTTPTAKLDISGATVCSAFRLRDGNENTNYVLTSDSGGYGTWKAIGALGGSGITGSTNGLSDDGSDVRLGGNLTQDTIIDGQGSYGMKYQCITSFCLGNAVANEEVLAFDVFAQDEIILSSVDLTGSVPYRGELQLESSLSCCSFVGARSGSTNLVRHTFDPVDGGILVRDDVGIKGMCYAADYSANWDDRSIPDKAYVDSIASGLDAKDAVVVATTIGDGNIDISGGTFVSGSTLDSTVVEDGWRVLVKNQTNAIENGIYVYSASTSGFTRSTDFDGTPVGEVSNGAFMTVVTGSTLGNTQWVLTTPDPITVGVTELNFSLLSQSQAISAGSGITINTVSSTQEISVNIKPNNGLGFDSGQLFVTNVERTTKEITQASHGFVVGDAIAFSGGTYIKAIADGTMDAETFGLVVDVADGNTFTISNQGFVDTLSGLIASTTYFVSDTTPGLLTTTEPTTDGHISKPILASTTSTAGLILPYRGNFISTGETALNAAQNGLNLDGTTVKLGGQLIETTDIDLNGNTFTITDGPIDYAADYSGSFGVNSLVDKNYVTGITTVISAATEQNTDDIAFLSTVSGVTDPAGSDTQIQYNDSGAFGADSNFTWDSGVRQLNIFGDIAISGTSFFRVGNNNVSNIEIGQGAGACGVSNSSIGIGRNATASGSCSIAIGEAPNATQDSIAIGRNASGTGGDTIAMGTLANASNTEAISIGNLSLASGLQSIAIGDTACGTATNSIAIGTLACGTATNSIAIGTLALSTASCSISIGLNSCTTSVCGLAIGGKLTCSIADGANAFGSDTIAGGIRSTAIGSASRAYGAYGLAIGRVACACGNDSSIAIGRTVISSGDCSIVLGQQSCSISQNSIAIGRGTRALANNSTVIGEQACSTGADSIAIGRNADTLTQFTIAIGCNSSADGNAGIAIGRNSNSSGDLSVAVGNGAYASNANTISIGVSDATGSGAIAMGSAANATGSTSVAIGCASLAAGGSSVALGVNTDALGTSSVAIGNGAQAIPNEAIAMGELASATGGTSIAIGEVAIAHGGLSMAVGRRAQACGNCSAALGLSCAWGGGSITMGFGASIGADGTQSTAIGRNACTNSINAVVVGSLACAENCGTVAIGVNANAIAADSVAIGEGPKTTGNTSVGIGSGVIAGGIRSVAIGVGVDSLAVDAIAMGRNVCNELSESVNFGWCSGAIEPTIRFTQNGDSYLDGESQRFAIGHTNPDARIHIVATGATEGFRLQDGNEQDGYVLTSDADGNASWQTTGGGTSSLTGNTIDGDNSTTVFTINHGCGTRDLLVQVYENQSPYGNVLVAVERPNTSCITVTFDTAPTLSESYRVLMLT